MLKDGGKTVTLSLGIKALGQWLGRHRFPLAIGTAVLVLDLLALRGSLVTSLVQRADLNPPIWGWSDLYFSAASGWNFQTNSANGYAGWLLWQGFIASASGCPGVVEVAFVVTPIPLAFAGCYLFLRRWGITSTPSTAFAAIFQFSPWFIGQLLTGEPVFEWVFAILPWYLWALLGALNAPGKLTGWLTAALPLSLAAAFSLQTLPLFAILTTPFLAICLKQGDNKSIPKSAAGLLSAYGIAVVVNLASAGPYLTGLSSVSATSSHGSWTAALVGPEPSAYWLAIFALIAASCLSLLIRPLAVSNDWHRPVLLITVLEATVIEGMFFAIPSTISRVAILDSGILAPFVDIDKFLLIAWWCAFIAIVELFRTADPMMKSARPSNGSSYSTQRRNSKGSSRPFAITSREVHIALVLAATALLVTTSVFVSMQGPDDDVSGLAFLTDSRPLSLNEIPNTYLELRQFLLENGASFGFGFRTAVLPQNPGSYTPYAVGPVLIPGFVGPSSLLQNITDGFIKNDSRYAQLMGLQGVRFVALVSPPSGLVWPTLAAAGPSTAQIYSGGWIPLGNFTQYLGMIHCWSTFTLSFESPGLYVFENLDYQSQVTSFGSLATEAAVLNGTFDNTTELTPVGTSVIQNGSSLNLPPWGNGPEGGLQVYPNGTIGVPSTSNEPYVFQTFALKANQSYILNLSIRATANASQHPLAGTSTYASIYWDQKDPEFLAPTGGKFCVSMTGDLNTSYSCIFDTPSSSRPIAAALYVYFQTPSEPGSILYIHLSGIELDPVNISSTFSRVFTGVTLISSANDRLSFSLNSSTSPIYVVVPISFDPGWHVVPGGLGAGPRLFDGPAGLLTLKLNGTSRGAVLDIEYAPQQMFEIISAVGDGVLLCLLIAVVVLSFARVSSGFRTKRGGPQQQA